MSKLLWKPTEERIRNTNMHQYMQYVNQHYSKDFKVMTTFTVVDDGDPELLGIHMEIRRSDRRHAVHPGGG